MAYTTIDDPSDYFNTVLYTGNGSTQSITGVGFDPDWVWIKARGDGSWPRSLDSVRGATKELYQNTTNAENTEAAGLTSFDSDGFSLGSNAGYNGNTVTFASVCDAITLINTADEDGAIIGWCLMSRESGLANTAAAFDGPVVTTV